MTILTTCDPPGPIDDLLAGLAFRINAEHSAATHDVKSALQHALAAGKCLTEARSKVPHGQWLRWLAANCDVSERTAQLYMRIARERPAIALKAQRVAELTLRGAVKLIAPPLNEQTGSTRTRKQKAPVTPRLKSAWNSSSEKARNDFVSFAKLKPLSVADELKAFAIDELAVLLRDIFPSESLIELAGLIASVSTVDAGSNALAGDDDAPEGDRQLMGHRNTIVHGQEVK